MALPKQVILVPLMKLDQREALEGVDGSDHHDIQCGGQKAGPFDLPEYLKIIGAVYLSCFYIILGNISQRSDIENNGRSYQFFPL